MRAKPDTTKTRELLDLLAARHGPPAWAFLEGVRNATGASGSVRTADAVAMSLWPSRGLHLHGFEIKVSRSDWLRERDNPAKAEEIAAYCHFWWLVIDEDAIVANGECPATWGLLIRGGNGLTVAREPTLNKEAKEPTYRFLGSLLRKVYSTSTDAARITEARSLARDEGFQQGLKMGEDAAERAKKRAEELEQQIKDFEAVSGVQMTRWDSGVDIGAAVKLLTGHRTPVQMFERLAKDAAELAEKATTALDGLRRFEPPSTPEGGSGTGGAG